MSEPGIVHRYRILFKGIVQGVGFRPYIYRSARQFNLTGFVQNTSRGVILEVEGQRLDEFLEFLLDHLPPLSEVVSHEVEPVPVLDSKEFVILASDRDGEGEVLQSPDIAVCDNCKKELEDPNDRRYHYPFINCTDCGPRLTITEELPYDRPKTTMKSFPMCGDCKKEYNDPMDRRYHAQPVSCFCCGPVLALLNCKTGGKETRTGNPLYPLIRAAEKIKEGNIVAIKGLGGYHLACLATSEKAVEKLRGFKKRNRKPFALMGTLDMIRQYCEVSKAEKKYLMSPSAPILLLDAKPAAGNVEPVNPVKSLAPQVAPGQQCIGFMVPYTPIHILLMIEIGEPLVMTSANLSDEPIIYKDLLPALRGLSEYVLTHDREIFLFSDDSVARVIEEKLFMIRRSRGYVPFPVSLPVESPRTVLGLGPMMKNTFTVVRGGKAMTSPHIGDIETPYSIETERFAVRHYLDLFDFKPDVVAVDKHPSYPNRLLVREFRDAEIVEIQHHKAHVASLLAEKCFTRPIIGIALDGTGYGDDGKIWGGEVFTGDYNNLERYGHLKYFYLPSGDKSVKEPWRFALSIMVSLYGTGDNRVKEFASKFGDNGEKQLWLMNSGLAGLGVLTSSCGRMFDAAASLLGVGHANTFDGDLPSLLQALAHDWLRQNPGALNDPGATGFSIEKSHDNLHVLNLLPLFDRFLSDNPGSPGPVGKQALDFHWTVVRGMIKLAEMARDEHGIDNVGLTGGVFQNPLLLKLAVDTLRKKGFNVLIHSMIPPNDGGVSLGQAFLASVSNPGSID